jgi:hypothetical protein
MSRTAARQQAVKESSMYRQGSGWIVSTWDEAKGAYWLSHELPHGEARQRLADWREDRVSALLRSEVAAELGRAGGSKRSDAKAAAARENGKRGGRPRRPVP